MSTIFLWRAWVVTPRLTRAMGQPSSAVHEKEFLDDLGVGLGQQFRAAMLALHLLRPVHQAVALTRRVHPHLAGGGEREALLGAALGLHLGHFGFLGDGEKWVRAVGHARSRALGRWKTDGRLYRGVMAKASLSEYPRSPPPPPPLPHRWTWIFLRTGHHHAH